MEDAIDPPRRPGSGPSNGGSGDWKENDAYHSFFLRHSLADSISTCPSPANSEASDDGPPKPTLLQRRSLEPLTPMSENVLFSPQHGTVVGTTHKTSRHTTGVGPPKPKVVTAGDRSRASNISPKGRAAALKKARQLAAARRARGSGETGANPLQKDRTNPPTRNGVEIERQKPQAGTRRMGAPPKPSATQSSNVQTETSAARQRLVSKYGSSSDTTNKVLPPPPPPPPPPPVITSTEVASPVRYAASADVATATKSASVREKALEMHQRRHRKVPKKRPSRQQSASNGRSTAERSPVRGSIRERAMQQRRDMQKTAQKSSSDGVVQSHSIPAALQLTASTDSASSELRSVPSEGSSVSSGAKEREARRQKARKVLARRRW